MSNKTKLIIGIILISVMYIYGGTTGKIHGRITNIETGEPVPGISVNIIGTNLGAASDYEGNYFILNVPPGKYKLEASGIAYQKLRKEGFWVNADKSTKVDFELRYSDKYELSENIEQFYLQKFTPKVQAELRNLKDKNKLEYQRQLLRMYFKPPADSENETTLIFEEILKLTKQIDILGKEFKNADNEKEREHIQQEMMTKLEERFYLQEKKMEQEIKNLTQGIENLRKDLKKFRADKEKIIQKQFEELSK
jgi:hypothetical protein